MKITSLNIGKLMDLRVQERDTTTGIYKQPVDGPVPVGMLGFEADVIADERHHGGSDQAVYVYREEDYDWWSNELGHSLTPGTFGENLTITGLTTHAPIIGSRLNFSTVILEVTAPRIPCVTLASRMEMDGFVKRFIQAELAGFYCRVISEGSLECGESFTVSEYNGAGVSTLELFKAAYGKLNKRELQRILAAPIDMRSREKFKDKLARL